MNYCSNCGNKLTPSDVLCSRCGSLIEKVNPSAFSQPINNDKFCRPAAPSADIPEENLTHPGQLTMGEVVNPKEDEAVAEKQWLEIEEIDTPLPAPVTAPSAASEAIPETKQAPPAEKPAEPSEEKAVPPSPMRSAATPPQANQKPVGRPRSVSKNRTPAFVVLLIWVLTTAAVFTGFYFADVYATENYSGWDGFVRHFSKGKIELDLCSTYMSNIKVDVSEAQTKDGAPAHKFDVTLADGKSVKVMPLGESHDFKNGAASFTVPDESLAKSLGIVTTNSSMETSGVNLDIQTASQSFSYPITSLTLKLTDAQYKREKPSTETVTTTDTGLKISLSVSPDATVFINNENRSKDIDDFGHITETMPLELGENQFVIEVIQPGRHSIKDSFTMTRELPKISMTLKEDYLRVFESSFECRGNAQAGASVTGQLNGKKFTALVGEDGVFSFVCTLEKTGVYQMDVTATKEGLADTTAPVMVEYLPAQTTYMEKAKEMTVDAIVKDMSAVKGTDIKTSARIDGSVTSANHTQSFTVVSKEGAKMSCIYYGAEHLSAELEYTFYGVVDSGHNSFYVMFVE